VADAALPNQAAAFESQGVTLDDAFRCARGVERQGDGGIEEVSARSDLHAAVLQGTVTLPGVWGGANWGAERSIRQRALVCEDHAQPGIFKMEPFAKGHSPGSRSTKWMRKYVQRSPVVFHRRCADPEATVCAPRRDRSQSRRDRVEGPFGDAPEIRSQAALKGVPLPDRLGAVDLPAPSSPGQV
jgi:hypothetical protein